MADITKNSTKYPLGFILMDIGPHIEMTIDSEDSRLLPLSIKNQCAIHNKLACYSL